MTNKYLSILLTVCLASGYLLSAITPAQAAIIELPLNQSNTTTTISQGLEVTVLSADSERIFLETISSPDKLQINIFPLDSAVQFKLHFLNKDTITYNSQLPIIAGDLISTEHRLTIKLTGDLKQSNIQTPAPTVVVGPTSLKKYRTGTDIILSASTNVDQVTAEKDFRTYNNENLVQISPTYNISNPNKLSLVGVLGYTYSGVGSQIAYQYQSELQSWQMLPTYNDVRNHQVYFTTDVAQPIVAVFNRSGSTDGVASWYDQSRYKSFKYQGGNFTASRDYPKGTKLKVTRLKTGTSIIVTVNDFGPELKTGRIIDLDKKAFKQLGSTGAGEIYVSIEKIDG